MRPRAWIMSAGLGALIGATAPALAQQAPGAPGSADPAPVVGTYRLDSVGGKPLPARTGTWLDCREHILSSAVQLFADGRYVMKTLSRQDCPAAGPELETVTYTEIDWGRWRDEGGQVALDPAAIGIAPGQPAPGDYWVGQPLEDAAGRVRVTGTVLVADLDPAEGVTEARFLATDGFPGEG